MLHRKEAGEDGGPDEAAWIEAAAAAKPELLHLQGGGARYMFHGPHEAVLQGGGDAASMARPYNQRPARQRAQRRHARAQARRHEQARRLGGHQSERLAKTAGRELGSGKLRHWRV